METDFVRISIEIPIILVGAKLAGELAERIRSGNAEHLCLGLLPDHGAHFN